MFPKRLIINGKDRTYIHTDAKAPAFTLISAEKQVVLPNSVYEQYFTEIPEVYTKEQWASKVDGINSDGKRKNDGLIIALSGYLSTIVLENNQIIASFSFVRKLYVNGKEHEITYDDIYDTGFNHKTPGKPVPDYIIAKFFATWEKIGIIEIIHKKTQIHEWHDERGRTDLEKKYAHSLSALIVGLLYVSDKDSWFVTFEYK